jgi:hypothetical protein
MKIPIAGNQARGQYWHCAIGKCKNRMNQQRIMNLTKNRRIMQPLAWISMLIVGFFLGRIASAKFRDNTDATMQSVVGGKHHNTALDGAAYLAQMKVSTDQHPYSALHQAKVAACIAEFERKKDTFHYEGDIMARMREIVAEVNTEMELQTNLEARLLFHQWLCKNPRELFTSMSLIDIYKLGNSVGYDVTLSHLRTLPEKEVDEILYLSGNSLDSLGVHYFRKQIQEMKHENGAEKIIAALMQRSESVRGDCWQAIVAEFPPSMDSQLIDYVVKVGNPKLLLTMHQLRFHHFDQHDQKWLDSRLKKHPGLIDLLKQNPDVARKIGASSVAISSTSVPAAVIPLSWRLDSPNTSSGGNLHELVRTGALSQGSFNNILQGIDPNFATDESKQTQSTAVRALSKYSVEFGIKYLSSISDASDREEILMGAVLESEPDAFYQFLVAMPHDSANGPIHNRYSAWLKRSLPDYHKYGENYVSWVMALPSGLEKEMALTALSNRVKNLDPALSERLLEAKTGK